MLVGDLQRGEVGIIGAAYREAEGVLKVDHLPSAVASGKYKDGLGWAVQPVE